MDDPATMVERVAKALARTNGGGFYDPNFYTEDQRNVWRTKARDGIEAMQEPTSDMLDAAERSASWENELDERKQAEVAWRAMIDEALK